MHQLMRRTVLAVAGAGLGLAAAVTMAAGPAIAQPTPITGSYYLHFQDLNAPALPTSGDKIDGHGWISDSAAADPAQRTGAFTFGCHYLDESSAECSMEHYLDGQGYLHFWFAAEIDSATGVISLPSGADADITQGAGDYLGAYGSGYLSHQTGDSYLFQHSAFIEPSA